MSFTMRRQADGRLAALLPISTERGDNTTPPEPGTRVATSGVALARKAPIQADGPHPPILRNKIHRVREPYFFCIRHLRADLRALQTDAQ